MTLTSLNYPLPINLHLKLKPKTFHFPATTTTTIITPTLTSKLSSFKPPNSTPKHSQSHPLSQTLRSLTTITPYIRSQSTPILIGWLSSAVSVYSLSQIVPRVGLLSSTITDAVKLRNEGLALAFYAVVRLVATYLQQAFLWDAALSAVFRIRVHVFGEVLGRELSFFEGASAISAGDIAYRITAESSDVTDTIYSLLNTIVPTVLQLTAMATQMVIISPGLSLISVMMIPCMALAIAYLGEKFRKISKKARVSIANLSAYLNEVLPAIMFVKANNAECFESARFERLAYADLCKHLKKKKMKVLIPQIIQIIYFGAFFLFCAGSLVASSGSFDCCSLVSFVTSLVFLIEPIQSVGKAYNELKQGEPAIERLMDLTRVKSKVIEKPDAVDLANVTGDVKLCNISFSYGDDMPLVLNGLNLHIKAGETIALVGPSGGGKTTLIKLLLRLYDPSSGCILFDNCNIRSVRLDSLRRHVGLVSQDITLLSGTVAENIGYKDLMGKIDMERVELVARTANADEFIRSLPEGYNTNIGPRGSSLSGGQKQRVAIARALYQNSSILILDEATSALDSRSELLVRQALEHMMENHTVLVIAHRLDTALMANRVFLLNDGKLEERSPKTLMGINGLVN
ncbi:ABC_tran domain-containing protein/ABC_membrane domain-containing protein [Cephalotus follicularis]|uniref:ABC_tran domain-containing protein/ABC_membrane domain-containing protein n=1 Tax=Cephalotus follicularis TaxID=3775 RepID=A0A1Q3AN83_CEPFO|nr:ABC_tran domain-containing protein/ABC_membrane domain-containing protein [Cephalotus follicularis]